MKKVNCFMIYSSEEMTIKNITAVSRKSSEIFNIPIANEPYPYRHKTVSDMLKSVINILKENNMYVDSHITCGAKVPHIEVVELENIGKTNHYCLL